ncbi:DUF4236 domain-containing protein [Amycolatopsis sp. cmx-4-68]|uniref:DUF4236 domain-containing protein n=1 Tax=Amycolatopsis sp. cmx-4-68 TaxID=2790938 RepID=UPI0039785A71
MSIYLRTSIRLGPVRVGVSKSGIGVSAGVPGLRLGTGPRGSYVRVGVGGVSYRATLGGHRARRTAARGSAPAPGPVLPDPGDVVLSDVTGKRAEELLPATPARSSRSSTPPRERTGCGLGCSWRACSSPP